ncbi:MAG: DUF4982 domain-containing protein [Marinilabiliales bacterium]|nr:DUF4982 domain-containing protein [Marinilabiliales bacterium]
MNTRLILSALLLLAVQALMAQNTARINFDNDWKFHLGDPPQAEQNDYDDANWRSLNLPHDWSIEGSFRPDNPSGHQGGLLPGGIGWYRKHFELKETAGKHFFICFDGVYKNSTVYLNGRPLGTRPYGYATFRYDLTRWLRKGTNLLAVKVDNSRQPDSRWYTGAGIYRHVWLEETGEIHVGEWGTQVTTPQVSTREAMVQVATTIENSSNEREVVRVVSSILNTAGKEIATDSRSASLDPGVGTTLAARMRVNKPALWDTEHPNLHTLQTRIYKGKELVDSYDTPFGIRSIAFRADSGFFLNGKRTEIKGVCNHHDLGPLGSALNDRALQRQLELLKEMGCNGIRCSHNLMAPELLDLCDRMGFLVMDETFDCWYIGKDAAPFGFQNFFREWHEREITDMVRRDRTHPSVIFWSIGNEIKEQWFPGSTNGGDIARELTATIKKYDTSRFTTSAFNFVREADKKGMTAAVDVVGFNYTIDAYDEIRQKHPNWFYLASETTSQFDSRGVYHLPIDSLTKTRPDLQASAFDNASGGTTHEEAWVAVKSRPWMAGHYIWTGFDYFGEPAPYEKTAVSAYFGIFDLCGFPKDSYWFYKSQWTSEPMVHLLPHWNWKAGQVVEVVAYTNCDEVRLSLNDQPLGTQQIKTAKALTLRWKVPFEAGTLQAEGYRNGKLVASDRVRTAGDPALISLTADKEQLTADGKSLSYVTVRITDEKGILVPGADPLIRFEVEGSGTLVGVGNGNPISLEPAQSHERRAFSGMCLAILRSNGTKGQIHLKASSTGLKEAEIRVKTE